MKELFDKVKKGSWVTGGLIVLNLLIFFVLELLGDTENGYFMTRYGAMFTPYLTDKGEYWRLFTALFLHFGPSHIFNNVLVLFALGSQVEKGLGHGATALTYFFSGLGANLFSHLLNAAAGEVVVSAGASGAIFGLMGAMIFLGLFAKERIGSLSPGQVFLMLALSLYHGVNETVDDAAHLSGLVLGFLMTALIIFYLRRKDERLRF